MGNRVHLFIHSALLTPVTFKSPQKRKPRHCLRRDSLVGLGVLFMFVQGVPPYVRLTACLPSCFHVRAWAFQDTIVGTNSKNIDLELCQRDLDPKKHRPRGVPLAFLGPKRVPTPKTHTQTNTMFVSLERLQAQKNRSSGVILRGTSSGKKKRKKETTGLG